METDKKPVKKFKEYHKPKTRRKMAKLEKEI